MASTEIKTENAESNLDKQQFLAVLQFLRKNNLQVRLSESFAMLNCLFQCNVDKSYIIAQYIFFLKFRFVSNTQS